MALCFRFTFIDELPSREERQRRARSTPPVRLAGVDSVCMEVAAEVASEMQKRTDIVAALEDRLQAWLPGNSRKHSGGYADPQVDDPMDGADAWGGDGCEDQPVKEGVEVARNPGSYGHPEVCRKPCRFFFTTGCVEGDSCGYCHCCRHRPPCPTKMHRASLVRLRSGGLLATLLPHLSKRARDAAITQQVEPVMELLSHAFQQNPSWPSLSEAVAHHLNFHLERLTFGGLLALVFHHLANEPWVQGASQVWEAIRPTIGMCN